MSAKELDKIKYLSVIDSDFDVHGDWLIGAAEEEFIHGGYTHVVCDNEVCEAAVVEHDDGTKMVMIGETVSNDLWRE